MGSQSDNECDRFLSEKEVVKLIKEAILEERKRLAMKISYSYAAYSSNYEDGNGVFDWDETANKLSKSILEEDQLGIDI